MYRAHLQAIAAKLPTTHSDYNQHSKAQSQSLQLFKPFIDAAVAAHSSPLPSSPNGAFVIADFGCSTGLNSSDALGHVITGLREKYGMERCGCVLAVLNDLPRNPWSELFGFLHGDGRSVLSQHEGVLAMASAESYYNTILPANSLQLGVSSLSLHWLSRLPERLSNHCYAHKATESERQAFHRQSLQDWANFLTARSHELVPGGVLALNMPATHEKISSIFDESYEAAKSLQSRGVISSEELLDFNMRMYLRSIDDVTDKAQLDALGLEIVRAEEVPPSQLVFYEDFQRHGDADRFAAEFSGAWVGTCEPSFEAGLSTARSERDRRRICSEMRAELRVRAARRPELFAYSGGFILLLLRKRL